MSVEGDLPSPGLCLLPPRLQHLHLSPHQPPPGLRVRRYLARRYYIFNHKIYGYVPSKTFLDYIDFLRRS